MQKVFYGLDLSEASFSGLDLGNAPFFEHFDLCGVFFSGLAKRPSLSDFTIVKRPSVYLTFAKYAFSGPSWAS